MTILRLRWLYGVQGASLGLLLPFLVPLLDDRGLEPAGIGLVLGASGLVSLLSYAMWGALADGPLGRGPSIAVAGLLAAAGGLWITLAGSDPVALTLAVSLAFVGALPWGPISDALALGALGEESSSYGRLRAWASLGWAVSAISAGVAWGVLGSNIVFGSFALLALAVAGTVAVRGRASAARSEGARTEGARTEPDGGLDAIPAPSPEGAPAPPPFTGGLRASAGMLASPVLLLFLLGLLVTSVGEHATWRYVGLRILEQGGGAFLVGIAAALPALVEIPIFGGSRRWAGRLGLRLIFVLGALMASLLALLIGLAPEAWMVTVLRTIDGIPYALRYIGMVLIIGALLPRRFHALGQSMAWLVGMGVAPIIGDIVGGLIYDRYGGTAVFAGAALLISIGAAIAYGALSGPAFRRARPSAEPA
jgi:MFS transporter, PPP family, 3-phenylpropionic acid transporter